MNRNIKKEISSALGNTNPDIIFKNANVFDVFNLCFKTCDVAVTGEKIVGVGKYNGNNEIDLTGKFLIPGLIDGHVHIESSYLTPARYAQAIMPKGVTTVIADPHEIANVCGEDGLAFMFDSANNVPLDIHFMLPSCVPATPFDSSKAPIDAKQTAYLFKKYNFLGLGEMMNFPGVINQNDDVLSKLECSCIKDGHVPGVSGKELCAYLCTGIGTDHECETKKEALEKISMGMYVLMRNGTLAKNVKNLVKAVDTSNLSRFLFCTDDKHIDDIIENGTITDCIKSAISEGLPIEYALKIATINACECYGLKSLGAIAPSYYADFIICDDKIPTTSNILSVYKKGKKVSQNGKPLFDADDKIPENVKNTVNIKPLLPNSLVTEFNKDIPVIKTVKNSLITEKAYSQDKKNLSCLAVIERHHATGRIGKGYVKGIIVKNGAVAQTIGHDSHNITVLGDNDNDMRIAVNALDKDGGIAVVSNGEVKAMLPLCVGGLMSDNDILELSQIYEKVVSETGKISQNNAGELLMSLAFMSLLVIPDIRLSDKGLFDVNKFDFI